MNLMMIARVEDALIALIAIVLAQLIIVGIAVFMKSPTPMTSAFETIMRSFMIGMIDRLNRTQRSNFALIIRGVICFTMFGVIALAVIFAVTYAMTFLGMPYFIDIILLMMVMSPLSLIPSVLAVSRDNTSVGHYHAMAIALNQNLVTSDDYGLRRASYKTMASTLVHAVILPIMAYIIGGVTVAMIVVVMSMMVRATGVQNTAFLSVFLFMYRAICGVADALGAVFVGVASVFTTGGKPLRVFRAFTDVNHMTLSAMARTQSITLGGASQDRHGAPIQNPWVGDEQSTAKLSHPDVIRGCIHYGVTVFLICALLFSVRTYL